MKDIQTHFFFFLPRIPSFFTMFVSVASRLALQVKKKKKSLAKKTKKTQKIFQQTRSTLAPRFYTTGAGINTLLYVEHKDGSISGATLNALTAAKKLGGSVTALVAGDAPESVADQIAKFQGISKVLTAKNAAYTHSLPEDIAPLLVEAQSKFGFTHLVTGHTAVGKNVFPRAAALMDVAAISDITGIESEDTFVRPIYAGKKKKKNR